jgi:tetratricopeptide (TPR) repeat protein
MAIASCRDLRPNEVEENKEDFALVWLDGNIDDSPDSLQKQMRLRNMNNYCQFYTNTQLCLDFMRTVNNEKIFLVVSGVLAHSILPQIHSIRSVASVFIFCANCHDYLSLLDQYPKLVKIFTDENSLIESIPKTIYLASKQTLTFSLFDQKQRPTKDLSKDSASFLWYQLLIDVLKQMPQTDYAKQQMLDICSNYYRANKQVLERIQQFRFMYTPTDAVSWYTADSFVYRLLNKALRIEDTELLYIFRFFIIDLCAQLERGHRALRDSGAGHLTLFRGQQIPDEEFDKLKQSVGILISTNGFWSTTRDLNVALSFVSQHSQMDGMKQILFEISADPNLKAVVFADVHQQSRMRSEQEVLFSLDAVFKVESVQFDLHLKLWKIKMVATDDGSKDVKEYLQSTKKEMEEYSPTILFGRLLLFEMDQVDKGEKYFKMLLKTLPSDHEDMASVYNNIGNVYDTKREFNLALEYYNKAYEMHLRLPRQDHPHIEGPLCNIGNIYRHKGDYDRAMEYYHQSLTVYEKRYPGDHLGKARVLRNIGLTHQNKKEFKRALEYMRRAHQMFQRMLPNEHPDITQSLGFLGLVFKDQLDYDQALEYFHRALEIDEKVLSSDHQYRSEHIEWIVDIYKKQGEIERAFQFCQEKLADQKRKLGESHPKVAHTLYIMGGLLESNNDDKALECYNQALIILEAGSPPDHLTTARCLSNISLVYWRYDRLDEALNFRIRALEIEQRIHSSNHTDIAISWRCIGLIYSKMMNYPKALECLTNGLKIYTANYSSQHEDVKKTKNDIAEVKKKMEPVVDNL